MTWNNNVIPLYQHCHVGRSIHALGLIWWFIRTSQISLSINADKMLLWEVGWCNWKLTHINSKGSTDHLNPSKETKFGSGNCTLNKRKIDTLLTWDETMSCSSEDYGETKVIGLWHISSTHFYGIREGGGSGHPPPPTLPRPTSHRSFENRFA